MRSRRACPPAIGAITILVSVVSSCARTVVPEFPDAGPATPTIVQISASTSHSCALRSNGHVVCWGSNSMGEIGDGTTTARLAPTETIELDDAIEIAAGERFTCAARATGRVVCWGQISHGRVGAPAVIAGIDDAIGVAAGERWACARRRSGSVWCWPYEAREVPGLVDSTRLGLGWTHGCGVTESGGAYCWGANIDGELGNGRGRDDPGWPATAVIGLNDAIDIDAGLERTCAVRRGGSVQCWGGGFLGDGPESQRSIPGPAVVGISDAVRIAAGAGDTCVLQRDGRVACWGLTYVPDDHGSFAAIEQSFASTIEGIHDIVEIVAGQSHFCARRDDGHVFCWGANTSGQLGAGYVSNYSRTPVEVVGL